MSSSTSATINDMPTSHDSFVIFVDLLGFASLVLAEGETLDTLTPVYKSFDPLALVPARPLLTYRFTVFHRCLQRARDTVQGHRSGAVIVFSDSAFFVHDTLDTALDIARRLMSDLVTGMVPARIGIARGSFRSMRYVSDVSSQVSFHQSQFLGTGIVRAYQAERCGAKGMRILLHPDLEPLLHDKQARRIVSVEPPPQHLPVGSELNYLAFDFPPNEKHFTWDSLDQLLFKGLTGLRSQAPQDELHHYDASLAALNRMRAQLERAPLQWPDPPESSL